MKKIRDKYHQFSELQGIASFFKRYVILALSLTAFFIAGYEINTETNDYRAESERSVCVIVKNAAIKLRAVNDIFEAEKIFILEKKAFNTSFFAATDPGYLKTYHIRPPPVS